MISGVTDTGSTDLAGRLLYDKNGNLIGNILNLKREYEYTYDAQNRLISVSRYNSVNLKEVLISYTYDTLGRRSSKKIQNQLTEYIYSGNDIIEETMSTVNPTSGVKVKKELREYVYGSKGMDDIISVTITPYTRVNKVDLVGTPNTYYYEKDHLGSTIRITSSTGTIIDEYSYTVFGKAYKKNDLGVYKPVSSLKSTIGNTRLYTGREYDRETNLYYLRARYYDANLGRFISRDPIGTKDNVNLYTYVANSPVIYKDLFGKEKKFVMYFDQYLELDEIINDIYFFLLATDTRETLLKEYADTEAKAKYIHYNRNQLNTDLPISPEDAINDGWNKQPWIKNRYHDIGEDSGNIKYVSDNGHKEVIFTPQGHLVTSSENIGTYNFYSNTDYDLHKKYDVDPYYLWGNVENSGRSQFQRMLPSF